MPKKIEKFDSALKANWLDNLKPKSNSNLLMIFQNETSRLSLRIIEPNNGCNSIMGSKLELANNVGLIVRGGCSFLGKLI